VRRIRFGLRRAAIGILRTLIEKGLDIDLRALIEKAVALQPVQGTRVADDIYDYVMERAARLLPGQSAGHYDGDVRRGARHAAALASRLRCAPARAGARSSSCPRRRASPPRTSASRTSCVKADTVAGAEVDVATLREAAEVRLFDAVRGLRDAVAAATARREYTAALGQLAQLRPSVDAFFDEVMGWPRTRSSREPTRAARRAARAVQRRGRPFAAAGLNSDGRRCGVTRARTKAPCVSWVRLIFTAFLFLWTFFYAIFFVIACSFLPFRRRFVLARFWGLALLTVLKWTCRLDYVIEGRENLPPGNHIALWKHSSSWERSRWPSCFHARCGC